MSSISLSVSESNDCKEGFEKFVKEVKDLYVDIDSDESLSFDDVEVRVFKGFRSLEQKFLEMCVSKKAGKKESELVECPACKGLCRPLRKWSEALNVCEQVDVQELSEDQRWYVSCDGCHTNSPDGWKEVKVGCIYRDFPLPVSGGIPSVIPETIRYVAGRQNAAEFGLKLYALATQSGIYQKDIDTQEIVFIGDGALWIWNLCDEHFPNAVQIVDYMHAKSHLVNVVKLVFEETEAFDAWIKATELFCMMGTSQKLP